MKLSRLKTSTAMEEQGVLVTVPQAGDLKLRVRRMGNQRYAKALQAGLTPLRAKIRAEVLTDEEFAAVQLRAFCEEVLVGWEGAEDDSGNPIAYSPERAYEILSNPEYHDLKEFAELVSTQQQRYREEDMEDDLGNSSRSSNGSSRSVPSRSSSDGSVVAEQT